MVSRAFVAVTTVVSLTVGTWGVPASAALRATTIRVSESPAGGPPGNFSNEPAISANGRYVAFTSAASDLVRRDTNDTWDVFVRDLRKGVVSRVSLSDTGRQLDGASYQPTISGDGRYIAFVSFATNVIVGDPNPTGNIFLHDRRAGTTVRIPPPGEGAPYAPYADKPSISSDGGVIAFTSLNPILPGDTNDTSDVFVWRRDTARIEQVSVSGQGQGGDAESYDPAVSADGRYVAFASSAGNLVTGGAAGQWEIYLRDLRTRTTTMVSLSSSGAPADGESNVGGVSAGGRYVLFTSTGSNLVPGDTNDVADVFLRDRRSGTTSRVSVSRTGQQLTMGSASAALSATGRYAAFVSPDPSIVAGDTNELSDVFMRDLRTGRTVRASVPATGGQADSDSSDPTIDAQGHRVAFVSTATNLVPGPARGVEAVYLRSSSVGVPR
jgi:Tol biopolymer transport system component